MAVRSTHGDRGSALTRVLVLVAVGALVVAAGLTLFQGSDRTYMSASFPRTISLYEGSDVRILGVPVGQVEEVTPGAPWSRCGCGSTPSTPFPRMPRR